MGAHVMNVEHKSQRWPCLAIGLLLVAQATMIFTRAINWDEFFFYSQVHQYLNKEPLVPFNTVHVHLFAWLPRVASNSVDAIVVARIAMLLCEVVALAAIYQIARGFADQITAALAVLAYSSAGFVLQHGFSFRVDPMVTAALLTGLAILVCSSLRPPAIVGFGLALGLAGMITIKAILIAPAFIAAGSWRWARDGFSRTMLLRLAACAMMAVIFLGAIYLYHMTSLAHDVPSGGGANAVTQRGESMIKSAGESVFFVGIPPYIRMIRKAILTAPLLAILIVAAPVVIARSRSLPTWDKVLFAGLWLPILTLAFYRNTAPYYYVFVLPTVVLATIPAIEWARRRYPTSLITLVFMLVAVIMFFKEDRAVIGSQRVVAREAGRMFDQRIDYFDHNGMLAGYRKANGFMTPWGLEGYAALGKSMFRHSMEERAVPLLVANDPLLADLLRGSSAAAPELTSEDGRVLRENYLPVWGPIWLAGKTLPAEVDSREEVLVPGDYRVVGDGLAIGGKSMADGSIVRLDRGVFRMANSSPRPVRLLWADVQHMPSVAPPQHPIWTAF